MNCFYYGCLNEEFSVVYTYTHFSSQIIERKKTMPYDIGNPGHRLGKITTNPLPLDKLDLQRQCRYEKNNNKLLTLAFIKLEAQWAESVSLTFHYALRIFNTEPSIGVSHQVLGHLAKQLQRRRFLEIDQSETRMACGEHVY
jgi:hypothetical protein